MRSVRQIGIDLFKGPFKPGTKFEPDLGIVAVASSHLRVGSASARMPLFVESGST